MKNLNLVILLFLSTFLIAQEQITNITGIGSEVRYILKEHDGEKYIMATFPFDSLRVYRLVNGSANFLHSRHFEGIYSFHTYNTVNQYLLLNDKNGSIAYNFKDNIIQNIPYDPGFESTSWNTNLVYNNEILLTQSTKSYTQRKYLRYNLATNEIIVLSPDYYYIKIDSNNLYAQIKVNDSTIQYLTLEKETLSVLDSTNIPIGYSYFFDDNKYLVYFSKKLVKRYNFKTKTHELIYSISANNRGLNVTQTDDEYVLEIYLDLGKHNMIRIKKETLTSTQFEVIHGYQQTLPDLYYDKYVSLGLDINITDINTGQRVNLQTDSKKGTSTILENRYIIHYNNEKHLILDLSTMQTSVLSILPSKIIANKVEVLKDNNVYIFNYDHSSSFNKKLYEISLDSLLSIYSTKIPGTNQGLPKGSKLTKVGADIILANKEDLFLVKGSTATRLNNHPLFRIRHLEYKVENNKLFWAEYFNNEFNIYTLQNETATKIATIPNSIGPPPFGLINLYEYTVTPDIIYFASLGLEGKLFKYNRQTKTFAEHSEVDYSEFYGIYHSGNFYYTTDDNIVIIKSNGTVKKIKVNLQLNVINPFIVFKDRIFYQNREEFSEIVNDNLLLIKKDQNGLTNFVSIYNDYLILHSHPDDFIYDGTTIYSLPFDYSQYFGPFVLNDFVVKYTSTGTNTSEASLYNFTNSTTFVLPAEVAKLNNISIFNNRGKYVLIGSEGFTPFNKLSLFETDQNLTFFNKIIEFDVTSRGILSSFTPYINEGFLYTGNTMYLMDTMLNFFPIDNYIGENESSTVFQQDGYFYFVAIYPNQGRQLFRTQLFSFRTTTNDKNDIYQSVKCYPNPSSQELFFSGEPWDRVEITNSTGQARLELPTLQGNRIDISQLPSGIHIIILTSKTGAKGITKFVKID